MSKFSWIVFGIYLSILILVYFFINFLYWPILGTVLFLQITNMIFRKYINKKTKYKEKDELFMENEKIRFLFIYFGFPLVFIHLNYLKQLRKDSYYIRNVKELESLIKIYEENDIKIDDKMKNDWIMCNRYLKLKKIRNHKH